MSTRKKKKHVCSCGESFNHGIGLRKHQRQTGHKGSKIVEEGDDEPEQDASPPEAPAAGPPAAAEAEQPTTAKASPSPVASRRSARRQAEEAAEMAPEVNEESEDLTVAVSREAASGAYATGFQSQGGYHPVAPEPGLKTRLADSRQKLSIIGRGLKVLLAYRAKGAGRRLKSSARSGADIFREALKLAVALVCLLAIPATGFYLWSTHKKESRVHRTSPATFSFQDGALAARSTLLTYFDHLAKENWNQAYGLLSTSWQQELSPVTFRDAFLDISDLRWAVTDQRLLESGGVEVLVRIAFVETGQDRIFNARFLMRQEGQQWKVERAEFLDESGL